MATPSPCRGPRIAELPFGILVLVLLLGAACGSDHADAPLSLNQWDHGWRATIEPGEEFDIGLVHSGAHPDAAWQLVEVDRAVIELERQEEVTDPDRGVPPVSAFFFSGIAPGETAVDFELVVDGRRIDVAEYTVVVVEDACESGLGATANRCGRDFAYHPQDLTELDHGGMVTVEPGGRLDVTLTANALHPEQAWLVVDVDDEVVVVDGPTPVPPDRFGSDWGAWEPGERHSFLPASTFTLTGVAVGESTFVAEIRVDDAPLDRFELKVTVTGPE